MHSSWRRGLRRNRILLILNSDKIRARNHKGFQWTHWFCILTKGLRRRTERKSVIIQLQTHYVCRNEDCKWNLRTRLINDAGVQGQSIEVLAAQPRRALAERLAQQTAGRRVCFLITKDLRAGGYRLCFSSHPRYLLRSAFTALLEPRGGSIAHLPCARYFILSARAYWPSSWQIILQIPYTFSF